MNNKIGKIPSLPEKNDFAGYLHALRGVKIVIASNIGIKPQLSGLPAVDPQQRTVGKLLYIGEAGQDGKTTAERQNINAAFAAHDSHVYRSLFSPFASELDPFRQYGLMRQDNGDIWFGVYSHVFLKFPDIYEKGVLLKYYIPEEVAAQKPVLRIFCNDVLVLEEAVDASGEYERTLDIHEASSGLVDYLYEVRRQQLILLTEADRICREHGLRYYLVCGGLIGAVREGRLIPWDDDIDIAMPRRDYDAFCRIACREWGERGDFMLLKPEGYGEDRFLDFMTRLVYMKESFSGDAFARIGKDSSAVHYHLPMDIYILDDASDINIFHRIKALRIQLLYALALPRRESFSISDHPYNKRSVLFAVKLVNAVGKHIPLKWIFKKYYRIVRPKASGKSRRYYQSNGLYACYRYTYSKDLYGNGADLEVDGIQVRVPEKADELLRKMYGDYTKYPVIWGRKPMFYEGSSDRFFDYS